MTPFEQAKQLFERGLNQLLSGEYAGAEVSFRDANKLMPNRVSVLTNLSASLLKQDKLEEARQFAQQAVSLAPENCQGWSNIGFCLATEGRFSESIGPFNHALVINPNYDEALNGLGLALTQLGRFAEAEAHLKHAIKVNPKNADAYCNLGNTLSAIRQLDNAESCYRDAIAISPTHSEAYSNLAGLRLDLGFLDDAEVFSRQAIKHKARNADAHGVLCVALMELGKPIEAEAAFRAALVLNPNSTIVNSGLLFGMAYHGTTSPEDYLRQARQWETKCLPQASLEAAQKRTFIRPPRTGRRLKIGYVSGDFRQHAVSYFIDPLFVLRDPSRVELFAYATANMQDKTTEKLRASADHWRSLAGLSDAEACQLVDADGIDILVDLSGHTAYNRISVFAHRAAPVQAHYLGFCASTGLSQMDYWIGDDVLIPVTEEAHYSETIWRLPRVWVSYLGREDAPDIEWRPKDDESVCLGSFNDAKKINSATLNAWARILREIPNARLLLKTRSLETESNKKRIENALVGLGIAPERFKLMGNTPDWRTHMSLYNEVDIALDPIGGVGGGTTSCDALWMGVPVVTLAGKNMAQRMTASMLNAIGHNEWISNSEDDYIGIVSALAQDIDHRRTLRQTQRENMRISHLCNREGLARSLEAAYEDMFDHWFSASAKGVKEEVKGITMANNNKGQEC